jgi:hypothetical protein
VKKHQGKRQTAPAASFNATAARVSVGHKSSERVRVEAKKYPCSSSAGLGFVLQVTLNSACQSMFTHPAASLSRTGRCSFQKPHPQSPRFSSFLLVFHPISTSTPSPLLQQQPQLSPIAPSAVYFLQVAAASSVLLCRHNICSVAPHDQTRKAANAADSILQQPPLAHDGCCRP